MRSRLPRLALRTLTVATVGALGVAARPVGPGYTYRFTSTTSSGHGTSKLVGKGMTTGKMARLDIESTEGQKDPFGEKGGAIIMDGGAGVMAMVNSKGDCSKLNLADIGQFLGGAMQMVGAMVKMNVTEVNSSVERLGTESVGGVSTQHVRRTATYTLSASMFGRTSATKVKTTSDFWLDPSSKALINPYVEMGDKMLGAMGNAGGMKELVEKMEGDRKSFMSSGYPIKMHQVQEQTDEKGKTQTTTTDWEMTNIQTANVGDISIPATCQDIGAAVGNAMKQPKEENAPGSSPGSAASGASAPPVNADSIMKAAAESAKKDAAKDAVEKAKGKLRGIFKKP